MRVVCDIEANRLHNPDKIWVIVCKDIDTNEYYIFRKVTEDNVELERFKSFAAGVVLWVGHNFLGFDYRVLSDLTDVSVEDVGSSICDTLVLSRLIDYPRTGHSIESYGLEFGLEKRNFSDWSKYSKEMEDYCVRDVDICHKIYLKYLSYYSKEEHKRSIYIEHMFQYLVINSLNTNGFYINTTKANNLLSKVTEELNILDKDILNSFKSKLKLIRTVTPKGTKYGTISLSSIPKVLRSNISDFTIDAPFSFCKWEEFNPSSPKQIVSVLNQAGWRPVDKTKTHIEVEREYNKLNRGRRNSSLDLRKAQLYNRLQELRTTGWKVNEANLETLPPSAPKSARTIAKRIVLEARRRTLTEWLSLVQDDNRIHGDFQGIGAWTHRMAHQKPNTANIPNEFDTFGKKKPYGKELRSLWAAPKNRLLVGCDAEGIQLRIFAHYIDDQDFTKSLVDGKKEDKSDPHSLNQSILGDVCKSRAAAKRFIYALLLGAGLGKLSEILGCSEPDAQQALGRLMERYTGFAHLKETIIPRDAKRGWFVGLDGRKVRIPGDEVGSRRHLAMSGYLQCGEAVAMKLATLKFITKLKDYDSLLVNFVHDEWQVETPNDVSISLSVARLMADSLREAGEDLKLKCPLAGSYWNDDLKDYTIGTNWSVTH